MDSKISPVLLQTYDAPFCPSFSSYSSTSADVAARVRSESSDVATTKNDRNDDVEDEFEFVLVNEDQTETVFPVFNRDLLLDDVANSVMLPLKQLFLEDRNNEDINPPESAEMDSVPPGTYCVWTPKTPQARCKKSNSTGSSAAAAAKKPMWRLRDLLKRSSSDGKHSLVFLNKTESEKKVGKGKTGKEKVSAHEAFYVRNKALKEGDKRKSYLPYRQDLVGFFANANFGRTFPPF